MSFWEDKFTQRIILLALVIVLLYLLWQIADVLLLIFAAILLAVFLRGLSHLLSKYSPLSDRVAFPVVIGLLVLVLIGGGVLLAPHIINQVQQLSGLWQELDQQLQQSGWLQRLLAQTPPIEQLVSTGGNVLSQVGDAFASTLDILIAFVVILFVGVFVAINPSLYINGAVKLIPVNRRSRARQVIHAIGHTLRWWLIGRATSMMVVGLLTALGLWLLGLPSALLLGLLTGLLTFVPTIGSTLAIVPPFLLGLSDSFITAIYVVIFYLAIQLVESYMITPLVQRQTVSLPPALTVTAQVLMGVLAGALGVAMATPLAAVILVLVRMLYIEDSLGDIPPSD